MNPLGIASETLLQLAESLEAGHVRGPFNAFNLRRFTLAPAAVQALADLRAKLGTDEAVAAALELVVAERRATEAKAAKVELVWTGPEEVGASSRDTKIVVAELFERAQRSVLVASYNVGSGAELFAPLAARMAAIPSLRVRMFFDLTVGVEAHGLSRQDYETRFARGFRMKNWPAGRTPEVFHDPRTIDDDRISFHAKCVVIDEELALVTSANASKAAQQDNIEAGVLVEDRAFARALIKQFDDLIAANALIPVAGLGARE